MTPTWLLPSGMEGESWRGSGLHGQGQLWEYLCQGTHPSVVAGRLRVWLGGGAQSWPVGSWPAWRTLKNSIIIVNCYFVIISPWKRMGPFIWINLNPLHPRMFCAKFVEIGLVVLEKKMYFEFAISLSSPLGKGQALHLKKKKLNPIHPRMLCAKFCWNWSVSLSTWRWKCEKFRQTDEQQVSFQLQCNKVNNFFIPNFWYSSNLKDHFLVTASVIFNMKHVIHVTVLDAYRKKGN